MAVCSVVGVPVIAQSLLFSASPAGSVGLTLQLLIAPPVLVKLIVGITLPVVATTAVVSANFGAEPILVQEIKRLKKATKAKLLKIFKTPFLITIKNKI